MGNFMMSAAFSSRFMACHQVGWMLDQWLGSPGTKTTTKHPIASKHSTAVRDTFCQIVQQVKTPMGNWIVIIFPYFSLSKTFPDSCHWWFSQHPYHKDTSGPEAHQCCPHGHSSVGCQEEALSAPQPSYLTHTKVVMHKPDDEQQVCRGGSMQTQSSKRCTLYGNSTATTHPWTACSKNSRNWMQLFFKTHRES